MKSYLALLITCLVLFANVQAQQKPKRFSTTINGTELWGYKDAATGKILVSPKYTSCNDFGFSTDYAQVELNGKKGIMDINGKEICPIKYDQVLCDKSEGLFVVTLNNKSGFINTTGKEIIPLIYALVQHFSFGRAWVSTDFTHNFFIDTKGNRVIDGSKFEKMDEFFEDGFCFVSKKNKYSFIDVNGKNTVPFKYDYVQAYREGFAVANIGATLQYDGNQGVEYRGGKWGFINKAGIESIPLKYDGVIDFSDGLAAVKLNDKWGFIDSKGKQVIPFIYNYINRSFYDGKANVYANDRIFDIDKTGKEIIE